MDAHWSKNALTVRIGGINAICSLPLLLVVIRPFNLTLITIFLLTLIYFVITDNLLKLKPRYTLDALRVLVLGSERTVKNRELDL